MSLNKKVAIPLAVIILAAAAGGGWFVWHKKQAGPASETKAAQGKQLIDLVPVLVNGSRIGIR